MRSFLLGPELAAPKFRRVLKARPNKSAPVDGCQAWVHDVRERHVRLTSQLTVAPQLMEAVDGWMTAADVGTAAGVRLRLSAGGTERPSFRLLGQYSLQPCWRQNVSLFALSRDRPLVPVEFSSRRVPDVALDLDAEGELRARMVGDAEREDLMYSAVDEAAVDTSIFPRFALAKKIEHVQRAGECLLIPAYWWHNVRDADADSATAPSAHAS